MTHLDGHARAVEAVGEQHMLAQHPLETRRKLNLRDRECMSEVQGAVRVGVGKVAEPFGELLSDLRRRQTFELLC